MDRRVLIVDDDPSVLALLRRYLTIGGYEVISAENGAEALQMVLADAPPIVITDWSMPEMDGVELTRALRTQDGIGYIYVIILTAHTEEDRLVAAFDAGADDYLTKPVEPKELLARLRAGRRINDLQAALDRRTREVHLANARMAVASRELARANGKLTELATTDELTGLPNRREAMRRLGVHWASSRRHGETLSCMVLDIDHFKQFNDTHGHAVGDRVLRGVATALRRAARMEEAVCRIGGEEFLVLCPYTTVVQAQAAANRLRQAVELNCMRIGLTELRVTISVGVAERTDEMSAPDELVHAADEALYLAKRTGRNRVCMAEQSTKDSVDLATLTGAVPVDKSAAPGKPKEGANERPMPPAAPDLPPAWELRALLEFSRQLAGAEDLPMVLDATVEAAVQLTSCGRVSLMLPDADGKILRIAKAVGIDPAVVDDVRVPIGGNVCGQVYASGEPRVIGESSEAFVSNSRYDSPFFASVPLLASALHTPERVVGVLNLTERVGGQPFSPVDIEYITLLTNMAASAIHGRMARQSGDEARDAIVVALARLAEHRDTDTRRHVERVTLFSVMLAEALARTDEFADQIDDAFLRDLERAAPLHDIGKVAIPDSILLKPGTLTPEERKIMETHAEMGAQALRSVVERAPAARFLQMAEEIAMHHHEWYDGNGYPRQLAGDAIPLAARILAVADVYDAVTTRRVYKGAMTHDQAASIICESSGKQFAPALVAAFLELEADFARLSCELSDPPPDSPPPPHAKPVAPAFVSTRSP